MKQEAKRREPLEAPGFSHGERSLIQKPLKLGLPGQGKSIRADTGNAVRMINLARRHFL
jgi:hypothetical protein